MWRLHHLAVITLLAAAMVMAAGAVVIATWPPSAPPRPAPVMAAPPVPVITVPPWCAAYEPDPEGQAAVAGVLGLTCRQLLALLAAASGRTWVSTAATDGIDWPRVAKLRRGAVVIRIWRGNDSGAAQSLADELHARGWESMPGD
jgi:hypothetical protein